MSVDAVRYNGTIHDFVLLNALRKLPSTEAAIRQTVDDIQPYRSLAAVPPEWAWRQNGASFRESGTFRIHPSEGREFTSGNY